MTDLVPLAGVEEQDMIGVGHGLIASDVPQVDPAIGKYKVRRRGAFLYAAMTTLTGAANVAQRYRVGAEQPGDIELGCSRHNVSLYPSCFENLVRRTAPSVWRLATASLALSSRSSRPWARAASQRHAAAH